MALKGKPAVEPTKPAAFKATGNAAQDLVAKAEYNRQQQAYDSWASRNGSVISQRNQVAARKAIQDRIASNNSEGASAPAAASGPQAIAPGRITGQTGGDGSIDGSTASTEEALAAQRRAKAKPGIMKNLLAGGWTAGSINTQAAQLASPQGAKRTLGGQ